MSEASIREILFFVTQEDLRTRNPGGADRLIEADSRLLNSYLRRGEPEAKTTVLSGLRSKFSDELNRPDLRVRNTFQPESEMQQSGGKPPPERIEIIEMEGDANIL